MRYIEINPDAIDKCITFTWHADIPAMICGIDFLSPKYLVTMLPPIENPIQIIFVVGYRATTWRTMPS